MIDRRFLASNGRVARRGLEGEVNAERFVDGKEMSLVASAFLRSRPGGARDRQLLFGDIFLALAEEGDLTFGVSMKDGYVGYLAQQALGPRLEATHWVSALLTHGWPRADLKGEPELFLPMMARVSVSDVDARWSEITGPNGAVFVPSGHLSRLGTWADDVVSVVRRFVGTPYVWAGNEASGLDCSGLVQVAFHASGFACPPDSDLQARMPGELVGSESELAAGDLVFWAGHVAMASGAGTLIHANAHHMAVVEEPVVEAIARIAGSDTGPVTSMLRPDWSALRF